MTIEIANVNYLTVLIATVIYFFIGILWYTVFFGKRWKRAMNLKKIDMEREKNRGGMWRPYVANFLSNLVLVYVLAVFVRATEVVTILGGMYIALLIWLGFVATISIGTILWEGKPLELYLINNAYHLVALNVAAILLVVI